MRLSSSVAALASILLLAGCGASGTAPSSPTSSAPTAAPSPSATADASTTPLPTVPLECAGLAADGDVAALVGESVTRRGRELRGLAQAATYQGGVLLCDWRTAGGAGSVQLQVLSDGAAGRGAVTGAPASAPCSDLSCQMDELVGDYWVTASVYVPAPAASTAEQLNERWGAFTGEVRSALAAADKAVPQWVPPASGFELSACRGAEQPASWPPVFAYDVSRDRAPVTRCILDGWTVGMLDGGAWAMPELQLQTEPVGHFGGFTPFALEGVETAVFAPVDEGCVIDLTIDHQLVEVSGPGRCDDVLAAAPTRIAAIIAAG